MVAWGAAGYYLDSRRVSAQQAFASTQPREYGDVPLQSVMASSGRYAYNLDARQYPRYRASAPQYGLGGANMS